MDRENRLKKFSLIVLLSCIFFVLLCAVLKFVHSPATPLIGIVFVSFISWKHGTVSGLLLTVLNHIWTGVGFRLLAPEFAVSFPVEAVISVVVHIGVSFLLGYFGELAVNLRKEIEERKKAELSLKQLHNELEERVAARTRELEKANEQLHQARKMQAIGHLAGSIAHDFNNYLNIIIGYSSLLTKKIEEQNPAFEFAQTIEKTAETAAELTSQLLTFARKKKFPIKSVNLNDLIKELIPLLSSAVKNSIEINLATDPHLPVFKGGADQIKSALLNLGINARDAMPRGGSLTFMTETVAVTDDYCRKHGISCVPGTYAAVAVTDTGTGIKPEVFSHLFEPFFTTKEEGEGTGMGLAAVYGIAQSHHGAVFAETEPGKWTTFTMLFPVTAEKEEAPADTTAS